MDRKKLFDLRDLVEEMKTSSALVGCSRMALEGENFADDSLTRCIIDTLYVAETNLEDLLEQASDLFAKIIDENFTKHNIHRITLEELFSACAFTQQIEIVQDIYTKEEADTDEDTETCENEKVYFKGCLMHLVTNENKALYESIKNRIVESVTPEEDSDQLNISLR